jgi:hypothetical protein
MMAYDSAREHLRHNISASDDDQALIVLLVYRASQRRPARADRPAHILDYVCAAALVRAFVV